MKTKYLIPAIAVLAVALYFIFRKAKGLLMLDYSFGAPKPKGSLLDTIKSLTVIIPITLKNYSNNTYKITALRADMLTRQGNSIASQTQPITQPIIIAPSKNTTVLLEYGINWSGITSWLNQENVKITDVPAKIKSYLKTEKLNIPVVISGAVEAEGIFLNIKQEIIL
ncbi:MAG TPA: hypothetical protein DCQ31_07950 [Bacteroidales bacterium]|nr:hypothetical protein [Bacteroidales bacterium]